MDMGFAMKLQKEVPSGTMIMVCSVDGGTILSSSGLSLVRSAIVIARMKATLEQFITAVIDDLEKQDDGARVRELFEKAMQLVGDQPADKITSVIKDVPRR